MPRSQFPLKTIRERLLDALYRSLLPFAALAIIGGLLRDFLVEIPGSSWVPGAILVGLGTIHLFRSRIGYTIRSTVLLAALQMAALSGMFRYGIGSPGIFLLPASVVVTWLLLEFRATIVAGLSAFLVLVLGASLNILDAGSASRLDEYNRRPEFWLQIAMVMCLCGAIILMPIRLLLLDLLRKHRELASINSDLEDRVLRRTQRLERSRRDLQAFSFAVSHDLQAPLRAINGFATILKEDASDKWSAEDVDALSRILAGTKRMGEIIDTLLGMASLEREALDLETVDLGTMAAEIAQEIDHDARTRGLKTTGWKISTIPPCSTDPFLVRQLLTNLMSNAAKFSRASTNDPVVSIGSEKRADGLWIHVKDNGPGIDPKRTEHIFRMFNMEHGSEIEGKGIGLATVKRILDRLDGSIEVESQIGKGARFSFRPTPDDRDRGTSGIEASPKP